MPCPRPQNENILVCVSLYVYICSLFKTQLLTLTSSGTHIMFFARIHPNSHPPVPASCFWLPSRELKLNPSVTVELGWEVWKSEFWKFIHIILITVDVTAEKIPLGTWKDPDSTLQLCLLEVAELGAWELALWIKVLAIKAREPEFKSPAPTQKLASTVPAWNSSVWRWEGGSREVHSQSEIITSLEGWFPTSDLCMGVTDVHILAYTCIYPIAPMPPLHKLP